MRQSILPTRFWCSAQDRATIREIVDIELPRPRPLAIKRSATFLEYEDRIWAMIEREARQTMNEGVAV